MMKKLLYRLRHRERAQGMVEFALVLPLLLLLIFGVIEVGRLFVIYTSVSSASREAARYAAAAGDSQYGMEYYNDCQGIREAARRVMIFFQPLDPANVVITHEHYENGIGSLNPVCEDLTEPDAGAELVMGDRVFVSVAATYEPLFGLTNFPAIPLSSETRRTLVIEVPVFSTLNSNQEPPPVELLWTLTPTPTPTDTLTPTPTETPLPSSTPTDTPPPSLTPTDTLTPTITLTFTPGPSPTPTDTPTATPTDTSTPTATSTQTPTFTPIPPCLIGAGTVVRQENEVSWTINNNGPYSYTLRYFRLPWFSNTSSVLLTQVSFTGLLWSGGDSDDSLGSGFRDQTPGFNPPLPWAEMNWTPVAPNFVLPARIEGDPPTAMNLVMVWNSSNFFFQNGYYSILIFTNDDTGDQCKLELQFYFP